MNDYSKLSKDELLKIIEKLESRKKYGLIWDEEWIKEQFEKESKNALPVLVVCFEGGPLQISADAPKHCGANCHVKIIKTFA